MPRNADPRTSRSFLLKVLGARATLTIERVYPAIWPALAIVAVFVALSWLDVFERLPSWLHAGLLLALVAGLGWAAFRAVPHLQVAGRDAGLGRLERDSQLRHQALRALGDRLPEGTADPGTLALWEAHRARLLRSLREIRLKAPRSAMPARDPWALRALILLALVLGLVDARGEYGDRLLAALQPFRAAPAQAVEPVASLWVTPPAYTRKAPLGVEQTAARERLEVPVGSEALAQVHHLSPEAAAGARLQFGEEAVAFTDLGQGSIEVRHPLDRSGRLAIVDADGRELAGWQVDALPDRVPSITFVGEPRATHNGVMRVDYEASDDYGLAAIDLELAPKDNPAAVERFQLAKPASQPASLKTGSFLDLTAHKLAGLPARLVLEGTDAAGQIGRSEVLEIVLPERAFRHPLARAIIEQRKRLVSEPEEHEDIGTRLAMLGKTSLAMAQPATVPLSLNIAGARTQAAETPEARDEMIEFLWQLALYIEDGDLSTAEQELRALQERLQQALMEDATDQELEQLMAELQQAIDRFLDELTRQAMEQAQQLTPEQLEQMRQMPMDPSRMVDRNDLQQMLDRARELMRSGARDQAQQMLSQLQQMLENLQAQMAMPQQMGPQQQALSDLQRMIQMQQNLLDRSFEMDRQQGEQQPGEQGQQQQGQQQPGQQPGQQQGQQGQEPGDSLGRAAAEQEALRRALGELMRRMGEAGMELPRALGQAEMQMRDARDSLQQGQPGEATGPQASALDLMQQGGQQMMEQLQQAMGEQMGPMGPGTEPLLPGRAGRDPLGRSQFNDGGFDPYGERVPDEADLGRARDVLDELYRRSGERTRPQQELDYYNRLLDRF